MCFLESLNPSIIVAFDQQVAFSIMVNGQTVYLSAIYGSTSYLNRRKFWQELNDIQLRFQQPWCFLGDFNVVLGSHEYRGKGRPLQIVNDDFRQWTDCNSLTHILTRGA